MAYIYFGLRQHLTNVIIQISEQLLFRIAGSIGIGFYVTLKLELRSIMKNFNEFMGSAYENFQKSGPESVVKKIVKGGAYFKDLQEIPPTVSAPPEYRREGSPEQLRDLLMSKEQVASLLTLTEQFPDKQIYRARQRVGSKEKGTIHPHDFSVERDGEHTYLYFVDPEQSIQSNVRPRSVYLEAMHMYSTNPPEIAIFRCRAADLPNQQDIKADALLQEARHLIVNHGMPRFIGASNHNQITMRLVATQEEGIAQIKQIPSVNEATISKLLEGRIQSPILDGIIKSHQIRIQQFTKLLEEATSASNLSHSKFQLLPKEKYNTHAEVNKSMP